MSFLVGPTGDWQQNKSFFIFWSKKRNKKEESQFYNEEVSKVSKETMMERIAEVVRSAREKEKKGRDEEE